MKKIIFISFSVLLLTANLYGQKYDYQWPFGYSSDISLSYGFSLLDFNEQNLSIDPYAEVEPFQLSNGGSFICDTEGELMLMTNNCTIVDADFQIIEGGDSLTPGYGWDFYCEDGIYPAYHSTLLLPHLVEDSITYLLHKDIEASNALQTVLSYHLYLSTIVKRSDGSFYVAEKKSILDTMMTYGRLVAGVHADADKWWAVVLGFNSNRFYKFLLGGADTLQGPFAQSIGPTLLNNELDIGQPSFSPDMSMLAFNSKADGVLLYDFDPENGELSNFRSIPYPNMETAEGLVFSPNSRFIYVSTAEDLYQIDLLEEVEELRVHHLDHIRSADENNWPVGLGMMYLGPDCRIYISPGTTTYYMHVIHQPNQKGNACELEEKAIRTPTRLRHHLPHLPMYRFNGNCDSTIAWDIPTDVSEEVVRPADIQVYPNPADALLHIELPADHDYSSLRLMDTYGQLIQNIPIATGQGRYQLWTADWPAGVYFLVPDGTKVTGRKVVIVH